MWNFSWVLEDAVAGMAMPGRDDAGPLREEGITALVSLTVRPAFNPAPEGMRLKHVPVVDMSPPSQAQLLEAVRFIEEEVAAGGRVAVHCAAGVGRTGTVLSALLVARGLAPEEALHRVRDLRPGSVETVEQEHAVHRFHETWAAEAGKGRSS